MIYIETELWEILIPSQKKEEWENFFNIINTSGITFVDLLFNGLWKNNKNEIISGKHVLIRIACSEEKIKEIMKIVSELYNQEEVLCYKISNKCFIGEKELAN